MSKAPHMSLSPLRYGPVRTSFEEQEVAYHVPSFDAAHYPSAQVGTRPRSVSPRSQSKGQPVAWRSNPLSPLEHSSNGGGNVNAVRKAPSVLPTAAKIDTNVSHRNDAFPTLSVQPSGLVGATPHHQPASSSRYEDPDAHMKISKQDRSVALSLPLTTRHSPSPHGHRNPQNKQHGGDFNAATDPFGTTAIFGSLYKTTQRTDGGGEDAAIWVDAKVIEDGLPTIYGAMIALILCRDSFQLLVPKTKFTIKVLFSDIFKIELEQNIRLVIHCGTDSHRQYILDFRGSNNRVMPDEQIAPKLYTILSSVITPRYVAFPPRPDPEYISLHTTLRASDAFEETTGLKVAGKNYVHQNQAAEVGASLSHFRPNQTQNGTHHAQFNDSVDTVYNAYNDQKALQRSMAAHSQLAGTATMHGASAIGPNNNMSRFGNAVTPKNGWSPFDHSTYADGVLADDEDLSNASSRRHSAVISTSLGTSSRAAPFAAAHPPLAHVGDRYSAVAPEDRGAEQGDTIQLIRKTSSGNVGSTIRAHHLLTPTATKIRNDPSPLAASKVVIPPTPAVTAIVRRGESAEEVDADDDILDMAIESSGSSDNEANSNATPAVGRRVESNSMGPANISYTSSTATGSGPPHALYSTVSGPQEGPKRQSATSDSTVRVRVPAPAIQTKVVGSNRPLADGHVRAFTINPSDVEGEGSHDIWSKYVVSGALSNSTSSSSEIRGDTKRHAGKKPTNARHHSPQRDKIKRPVSNPSVTNDIRGPLDTADYFGPSSPLSATTRRDQQPQHHVAVLRPPSDPLDGAYGGFSLSIARPNTVSGPYPSALLQRYPQSSLQPHKDFTFTGSLPAPPYSVSTPTHTSAYQDPYVYRETSHSVAPQSPRATNPSGRSHRHDEHTAEGLRRSHSQSHPEYIQQHHSANKSHYKSIMLRLSAYDTQRGREALLKAMEGPPVIASTYDSTQNGIAKTESFAQSEARKDIRPSVDRASSPIEIKRTPKSTLPANSQAPTISHPSDATPSPHLTPTPAAMPIKTNTLSKAYPQTPITATTAPSQPEASTTTAPTISNDQNNSVSVPISFATDPMRIDYSVKAARLAESSMGIVGLAPKGMSKAVSVSPSDMSEGHQGKSVGGANLKKSSPEKVRRNSLSLNAASSQSQRRSVSPPLDIAAAAAAKAAAIRLRQQQERSLANASIITSAKTPTPPRRTPSKGRLAIPPTPTYAPPQIPDSRSTPLQSPSDPTAPSLLAPLDAKAGLKSTSSSVRIVPSRSPSAASSASNERQAQLGSIASDRDYLHIDDNGSFGGNPVTEAPDQSSAPLLPVASASHVPPSSESTGAPLLLTSRNDPASSAGVGPVKSGSISSVSPMSGIVQRKGPPAIPNKVAMKSATPPPVISTDSRSAPKKVVAPPPPPSR